MSEPDGLLRVGFDARWNRYGGVARYVDQLIGGFSQALREDDIPVAMTVFSTSTTAIVSPSGNLQFSALDAPLYSVREQLALRRASSLDRLDVLHSPWYVAPLFLQRCALAVTIHDLELVDLPEARPANPLKRWAISTMHHAAIARANLVLADSEATKAEICRWAPKAQPKVRVALLGADHVNHEEAADKHKWDTESSRLGLRRDYFLAFGGKQWVKKNVGGVYAGMSLYWEDGGDEDLVVIGTVPPDGRERLGQHAHQVHSLSVVSDDVLWRLLANATGLIFPSVHEGFGLPILEAMALGTPVITSNRSSLPEVAGDAAILIDPFDHQALARAVAAIASDAALRAELRTRGYARAGLFSWLKCARETLAAYLDLAKFQRA